MLMKKQFQSKSVPRGTRTIWRYLGALFILFTFAVGNLWADYTPTAAALKEYIVKDVSKPGGAGRFTSMDGSNEGIYFLRSGGCSIDGTYGLKTYDSSTPTASGVVFYLSTSTKVSVKTTYAGNKVEASYSVYIKDVTLSQFEYMETGTKNDKNYTVDLSSATVNKTKNISVVPDKNAKNQIISTTKEDVAEWTLPSGAYFVTLSETTDPVTKAKICLTSVKLESASSTLTLNPNGGTFDVTGWTDNNNGTWSKTVTNGNVTLPAVTKEHYHGGWNVSGNTVTSVNVSANTAVTAVWEIDTYTVNFLNRDNSVFATEENVEWNTTVSAPATDPEAVGYIFDGWDFDFSTPITANTNIESKWLEAGKTYRTITLVYDNGSDNGSESVEDGTAFAQPADPSKTGYTFLKWVNDDTEADYDFSASVTADITLKAIYTINKFTVNFLNKDASVYATELEVPYNTIVSAPATDPTAEHYTFAGWDFDFNTPITDNTDIASLWTAEQETLTFNSNGGSAVADQNVDYNTVIVAPVSSRTGWTLQGWTLDPTAEPIELYDFSTPITSDLDFTAVWSRSAISPDNKDIVLVGTTPTSDKSPLTNVLYQFNSYTGGDYSMSGGMNGNSGGRYITFTLPKGCTATVDVAGKGSATRYLQMVQATDITNAGTWSDPYVSVATTGTSNVVNGTSSTIGSTTATADSVYYIGSKSSGLTVTSVVVHVTDAPIYVTFMNGETQVAKIQASKNEKLGNLYLDGNLPVLPSVTGYTFTGWKNGSTAVDKNTAISASMTLTAEWTLNTHTLTWNFAEGATSATEGTDYTAGGSVAYGTAITYPSVNTMSRSGYDFAGWDQVVTSMPDEDLTITAQWTPEKPKHNIIYENLKGADNSANPIKYAEETGVAQFAPLADVEGFHFTGWSPASIAADATTDQTITAQWVPTYTVTYDLNGASGETPTEGVKLGGAEFTLAAAPSREYFTFVGWLCSADDEIKEASVAYTMTAANTTFTAQWLPVEELSDIYVWSKNTSYGGDDKCISADAANADAPAALHTSVTFSGFTKMGRATSDNTPCELTISVTREGYGIKSICTYGKFEESAGGSISWDGGTNWIPLAKYTSQKDTTFVAPDGTYPTSFKIKFLGVSSGSGGLWWRNALVTIEAKKTITGTAEELVGAKINGTALTDAEFAGLFSGKSFNDANAHSVAPTVTFVKQVTTSYEGLWPDLVENVEVPVVASDELTYWEAVGTVNSIDYTVTLAMPTDPMLETETTDLTLVSKTISTASKQFTFSGRNLENDVMISLASDVEGLTVNPIVVSPDANGRITNQEVTVSYASLEDVAEANIVLTVFYSNEVKKEIALTYSSTKGYVALAPVTGDYTWDFSKAALSENVAISNSNATILANYDVANDATIKTDNIEVKGERVTKTSNIRANYVHFHTTVPGRLTLEYSNTGGNNARTIYVNGGLYDKNGSSNNTKKTGLASVYVPAGDVVLEMEEMSTGDAKNVQLYKMIFTASNLTPDYTRPVTEGRYGTICLPNGGVMTGATLYEVAYYGETSKKIFFDEILNGTMEAGVPYIYLPNENATQLGVFYTDAAGEDAQSANGLVGYIGESEATEHALPVPVGSYILNNNQYREVVYANSAYILSHRAYINLSAINPSEPALVPGRRRISMSVQSEQVVTGIDALNAGEQPVKMMIDGKLYILRGEKMYDATGRLVK